MHLPDAAEPAVKAEAAATAFQDNGEPFAWGACSNRDIHARVHTKQQAVDDALRHAMEICRELRTPSDQEEPSSAATSFEERCGREIVEWMEETGSSSPHLITQSTVEFLLTPRHSEAS
jgi:hypothetical protein